MPLAIPFRNVGFFLAIACLAPLSLQQATPVRTTTALFLRANYPTVTIATPTAWIDTTVSQPVTGIGLMKL